MSREKAQRTVCIKFDIFFEGKPSTYFIHSFIKPMWIFHKLQMIQYVKIYTTKRCNAIRFCTLSKLQFQPDAIFCIEITNTHTHTRKPIHSTILTDIVYCWKNSSYEKHKQKKKEKKKQLHTNQQIMCYKLFTMYLFSSFFSQTFFFYFYNCFYSVTFA